LQQDPFARSAADAEQRFRELFDTLDAIVFEYDIAAQRFQFVSAQAERILGYPLRDWARPQFWEGLLHPEDRETAIAECLVATQALRNHELEYRMIARDGRIVWIRDTITVIAVQGRPVLLTGVMVDITAQKRAMDVGAEARSQLQALVGHLSIGVLFEDDARRIRIANPALCRMFGVADPTQVLGLHCLEALALVSNSFANYEAALARIEQIFARGETVLGEEVLMSDGRVLERSYLPIRVDHAVRGHLWQYEDVTERRRSERCVRDISAGTSADTGEEFYRSLVRHLASALGVSSAMVGELVPGSRTRLRTLAIWRGDHHEPNAEFDIPGSPCEIVVSEGIVRVDGDLQPRFGAHPVIRSLGASSYLGVSLVARDRRTLGVLSVLHDGALPSVRDAAAILRVFASRVAAELQRSQVERELRASEARNRALLDAHPNKIFLLDAENRYVACHIPEGVETLLDPASVIGRTPRDLLPPANAEFQLDLLRRMRESGQAQRGETSLRFPSGERCIEFRMQPLEDGKAMILARDLTEQRRLESELAQARRMESLGRLAGGVAHDFNNLLTGILSYAEIGEARAEAGQPSATYFDKIRSASLTAAQLTEQLLAFARKQVVVPRVAIVNHLVREMDEFLRRVLGETVVLRTELSREPWTTRIDPAQFHQVLMNLVVNSRDALPRGGTIVVATRNLEALEAPDGLESRRWIELSVTDDGEGIAPEAIEHVFEPFFTTKAHKSGSGIGLATCYGIVQQHGGHIRIASEPGRGTRIDVYLPFVEGTVERVDPPASEVPSGSESLLLVEDEGILRELLSQSLRQLGYSVRTLASAEEALALTEAELATIDLVVTDVVLSKMDGVRLAEGLRERRRDLRVLFITGYAPGEALASALDAPGAELLRKPFAPSELARKIRSILDAAKTA
jgi:PAS domain S-box-containing protein